MTPQVLGNTSALEKSSAADPTKTLICYVLQDASLSNTVLIDSEAKARNLPSVFSALHIEELHENDAILALNAPSLKDESYEKKYDIPIDFPFGADRFCSN